MMNELINKLNESNLYAFSDWKTNDIPNVCAELTKDKIDSKIKNKKKSGLKDRLGSHASGYRSGDRFNIYIADLYVLKTLSTDAINNISDKLESFDSHVKAYIQKNLHYRYVITEYNQVRELETYIQKDGINGILPIINPKN